MSNSTVNCRNSFRSPCRWCGNAILNVKWPIDSTQHFYVESFPRQRQMKSTLKRIMLRENGVQPQEKRQKHYTIRKPMKRISTIDLPNKAIACDGVREERCADSIQPNYYFVAKCSRRIIIS